MIEFFELIGNIAFTIVITFIFVIVWPVIICLGLYDLFKYKFEPTLEFEKYSHYLAIKTLEATYNRAEVDSITEEEYDRLETAKIGFEITLIFSAVLFEIFYIIGVGYLISYFL